MIISSHTGGSADSDFVARLQTKGFTAAGAIAVLKSILGAPQITGTQITGTHISEQPKGTEIMPHIHVTAPQGALGKNEQDALMSRLSDAALNAERAPLDDAGARSLSWAYYQEHAEGTIYVGGTSSEKPPFRIAITTPEGALNGTTRQELVAAVGMIVDDIVGPFEGRLNHWVMLYEVDEGSWAGGGQIFPLEGIQAAMNIKAAAAA